MEKQGKYYTPFATNLRKLIAQKRTTITALSKTLCISRQAVSQYADGTGQPNVDKLVMIAGYFGVSVDYLVGLSEIPTRNERIQGANMVTGLWEDAIARLKVEKDCEDDEISDFISYLVVNPRISELITAIKGRNRFGANPKSVTLDVEGEDYSTDMKALFKMIVSDLFFEIIDGYTAKSGEIMLGYKVGEDNG